MDNSKSLSQQIEEVRNAMIASGMDKNKGFGHEDTIKLSQDLDILINLAM